MAKLKLQIEKNPQENKQVNVKPKKHTVGKEYIQTAIKYKKYGGKLGYLMNTKKGFREFAIKALITLSVPAPFFLEDMLREFPDIPKELIPSVVSINDFKKKLSKENQELEVQGIALRLRDEVKIGRVLKDFDIFSARVKLYQKSESIVLSMEEGIGNLKKKIKKANAGDLMPSKSLVLSYEFLQISLAKLSNHLNELDKLLVRFGFLPAMLDNNKFLVSQQNNFNQSNQTNNEITEEQKAMFKIRVKQLIAMTYGKEENDKMYASYPKASEVIKEKIN
ncbi:hypothetical protein JW977_02730 [Candidatus Falkowbacteria bacterium]|nr:hypothetical protein [Candidatus Falkowbacteria bacterium]